MIRIPVIKGIIDRRLLVNFTAEPDVIRKIIPAPFSPVIYRGKAIVGICLIRLKKVRPKALPVNAGLSSENAAHRIAVQWEENGRQKDGVYIPRRDTSSRINSLVGGRLFPGKHFLADFNVIEKDNHYAVSIRSSDGTVIDVAGRQADDLPPSSIFQTLEEASSFFENGESGFSPNGKKFDGLRLQTKTWKVYPMAMEKARSDFFENSSDFPKGSVVFDHALLMKQVVHEWHSLPVKDRL